MLLQTFLRRQKVALMVSLQSTVGEGEGREGLPPLQSIFALSLHFLLYKASDVMLLKAPTTPPTSIPVWPRWL